MVQRSLILFQDNKNNTWELWQYAPIYPQLKQPYASVTQYWCVKIAGLCLLSIKAGVQKGEQKNDQTI
jgi:hypothetical protein